MNWKQTVYYGILLSLCLIFSYIEILIPVPVPLPGFKLGLSNIVILFAFMHFGCLPAFLIGILKTALMFLLFGNVFSAVLSICGFILSFLTIFLLYRLKRFSVVGLSMAGGCFHNIGQIAGAAFITGRIGVLRLIPALSFLGMITGLFVGLITLAVIERIRKNDRLR
ncbi:MAG: Gx transporter family protein [Lachnospiraceae bacterium]|nr:Gx transporter family protein [Lachnospiraceae bacterium]